MQNCPPKLKQKRCHTHTHTQKARTIGANDENVKTKIKIMFKKNMSKKCWFAVGNSNEAFSMLNGERNGMYAKNPFSIFNESESLVTQTKYQIFKTCRNQIEKMEPINTNNQLQATSYMDFVC